jgi:hypothetical protein
MVLWAYLYGEQLSFEEMRMIEVSETRRVVPIRATECLRRMPGKSQPQLMRAADGNLYVVKFQNNPQGLRSLANEMLGASLATLLGVPVMPVALIDVLEEMVFLCEGMFIEIARCRVPCQPGLCFGSQFRLDGKVWLPDLVTPESIENADDFLGMLVFDKWTSNMDGRQVAIVPNEAYSAYRAIMIDQGLCFGGEEWTFHNGPLRGVAHFPRIYERVTGIEDFEPWLARLERKINLEMLRRAAETVPPPWYRYYGDALNQLIWQLNERRMIVRGLVSQTLRTARGRFPNALVEKCKSV